MKKITLHAAFTLIELLVVISIIALLAGIAAPVYSTVLLNGKMIAAMNKAKQIGIALQVYANDNGGAYPVGKNQYDETINTSNDAFRSLLPTYLDTESVFAVPGSKAGPTADDRITSPTQILERGENHWAYLAGLNSTSKSNSPLIVDHTDGSGTFTPKENSFGGTWKGTKAIVIHVDSHASMERLLGTGDKRYIPRADDKTANALNPDYLGDGVKLLEPAE